LQWPGLPAAHLVEHLEHFLVVRQQGRVVGCAGLEIYGDSCLLRSLAVHPDFQGQGLGKQLLQALIAKARCLGLKEAVALTGTAVEFARRFGFREVPREQVAAQVRASWEFGAAACQSAACLRLVLREGEAP
jgi:amino-acid N-acetyltransferase